MARYKYELLLLVLLLLLELGNFTLSVAGNNNKIYLFISVLLINSLIFILTCGSLHFARC